ncbi:MAG: hypothetical protein WC905_04670 [Patescibacteria group bacterium]
MAISDKKFIQYIKISEFEPFANFWMVSAMSSPSSFSTDICSISSSLINLTPIPNAIGTDDSGLSFVFVSGYAPNLTVWFQDSSEAHTFPISSYQWNFGDPFNEGPDDITDIRSNYYTVTDISILGGDFENPCWITDKQGHISSHTYIMPGTYDVTLTVAASNTSTSDICACYVDGEDHGQRFHIYVEEIPPQCNGGVMVSNAPRSGFTSELSSISGISSKTVFFMASGIIAGSFPICRMDWDFGDGDIQRITRYPLTTHTDQGLPLTNLLAYPGNYNDPRNKVVPHTYTNTTNVDQIFNVSVSAYACNTNTMISCSCDGPLGPISPSPIMRVNGTRKLIGSRFDGDGNLIYILEEKREDEQTNMLHTIVLTKNINPTTTEAPTTTIEPTTTTIEPTTTTAEP